MLKKTKEIIETNNGITVLALVITIVLLLILAGMSINFVLGENGIVLKSAEAREKQQIADYKEAIDLILIDAHMQTYFETMTLQQFEQYAMQKMMQNSLFEGSQIGDTQELFGAAVRNVFLLTKEGYYFHITKNEAIYAGKTQQEVGLYLFSLDDTDDDPNDEPNDEPECTGEGNPDGTHLFNNGYCNYCGEPDENHSEGHTYEEGTCIYCGATDPDYDPNAGEDEGGEEEPTEEECLSAPSAGEGHYYGACGYCVYCHDAYDEESDTEGGHSFDQNGECMYCGYYDSDHDEGGGEEECPNNPGSPHSYAQCGYCEYCHDAYDEESDTVGGHEHGTDGYCIYCGGDYDPTYDESINNEGE